MKVNSKAQYAANYAANSDDNRADKPADNLKNRAHGHLSNLSNLNTKTETIKDAQHPQINTSSQPEMISSIYELNFQKPIVGTRNTDKFNDVRQGFNGGWQARIVAGTVLDKAQQVAPHVPRIIDGMENVGDKLNPNRETPDTTLAEKIGRVFQNLAKGLAPLKTVLEALFPSDKQPTPVAKEILPKNINRFGANGERIDTHA